VACLHLAEEDLGIHHAALTARERVATPAGEQEVGIAERPASKVDEDPEVGRRVGRRALRPERLSEGVPGDELPPAREQELDEVACEALPERRRGDVLFSPTG